MFIPKSFREDRTEHLHRLMQEHPLGLLISHGTGGLQASPVPFLLYPEQGSFGVLRAHLAKANPHWRELDGATECLVMFHGADGYVTPSWYPAKAETHRVVPTWNYAVVEIRGTPTVFDDAAWLRRQLDDLTRCHEGHRLRPWSLDDAPADFIGTLMNTIVGVEIPIRHIEGKLKMSQNRSADDRSGVLSGLRDATDPHGNLDLADQMAMSYRDGR